MLVSTGCLPSALEDFEAERPGSRAEGGGRTCSDARRSASAQTIPPIEWPIRITWTDGSTVGDGVSFATSMSMTLSWSLCREKDQVRVVSTGVLKATILPQSCCMAGQNTNHSRNMSTHCFRSPRVSNFGYVTATTAIFGSDLLRSARRCPGKPPKVSSPPYHQLHPMVRLSVFSSFEIVAAFQILDPSHNIQGSNRP